MAKFDDKQTPDTEMIAGNRFRLPKAVKNKTTGENYYAEGEIWQKSCQKGHAAWEAIMRLGSSRKIMAELWGIDRSRKE